MSPREESRARALTFAQQRVLTSINSHNEWVTVGDIAEDLDLHKNSVRAAIDALVSRHLIEQSQHRTGGRGRPSWIYRSLQKDSSKLRDAVAALEGASEEERRLLESLLNARHVDSVAHSENPTQDLIDFLAKFDMKAEATETDIEITSCPFRDINHGQPSYACRLHRIVLEQAVGEHNKVRLRPIDAYGKCHLTISQMTEDLED